MTDMEAEYREIRGALAALPWLEHHPPGRPVEEDQVFIAPSHRGAVDPDRAIVVGDRGMGKSFWTHALLNPAVRSRLADEFGLPSLRHLEVCVGFNGAISADPVAPLPMMLDDGPEVWRAVLARAIARAIGESLPAPEFRQQVAWVAEEPEAYAALLSRGDQALLAKGKHLLVLFDALDRLGETWREVLRRLQQLLRVSLEVQSLRRIRFKLFLRRDHYNDSRAFAFADASKIRQGGVELGWSPEELYELLFFRLRGCRALRKLYDAEVERAARIRDEVEAGHRDVGSLSRYSELGRPSLRSEVQERLISKIAGEYMFVGKGERRGKIYTWLPDHLRDAHGLISPRTFLASWRAAAEHEPAPQETAVDRFGIQAGVRRGSEVRLQELVEDYPWIRIPFEPLGEVPILRADLEGIWREAQCFRRAEAAAQEEHRGLALQRAEALPGQPRGVQLALPFPIPEESLGLRTEEEKLLRMLEVIGVVSLRKGRRYQLVDVPDIYRLALKIRRRGGVRPRRA